MWLSAIHHSEIVGPVFLDFKEALDAVVYTILQQKWQAYLNDPFVILLFQSYLSDRSQYVCANIAGVPQGSNSRPLLFCIFINDLQLYIEDKKKKKTHSADDLSLDTSGKIVKEAEVMLQKNINKVSDWC